MKILQKGLNMSRTDGDKGESNSVQRHQEVTVHVVARFSHQFGTFAKQEFLFRNYILKSNTRWHS